jgi:trehalose/maltose hydrolase-like predicted phosphorylase
LGFLIGFIVTKLLEKIFSLLFFFSEFRHVFWDAESWMFPALMQLQKWIGQNMLQYRFERMDEARNNARLKGYRGCCFPWESALSGDEVCPAKPNVDYELHISADIALAIQQHWYAHRDVPWLAQVAFPLLECISEFWVDRAEFDSSTGVYFIRQVMPPDEYHYPVDNNVFTNAMVWNAIGFTLQVADMLQFQVPEEWRTVFQVGFKLPFDQTRNRFLEYDGFHSEIIKQADTVMIHFPLGWNSSDSIIFNDLEYYTPLLDPSGPAMSYSGKVFNELLFFLALSSFFF